MFCCSLLGANFLADNKIIIDFEAGELRIRKQGEEITCPKKVESRKRKIVELHISSLLGKILVTSETETDTEGKKFRITFAITEEDLIILQNRDFALRLLKKNIRNQVPVNQWKKKYQSI